ncbi:MAG: hypothetical protein DWQ07_02560 [Chloroflexi bacterium]|nr:MAG: hypothetical protein DWQ07_02560 [Chloroflexota bacterium]MBL1193618.1 hypothetical protein [Chloroflexota bacterium]
MGFSFVVVPVSKDPGFLEWIEDWGLSLPYYERESRNPTPNEVRKVLNKLDGITENFRVDDKTWGAYIEDSNGQRMAYINCDDFQGDENEPSRLSFDGDSNALFCLRVVQQLTNVCGPLAMVITTGSGDPVIITPDTSPEDAFNTWEETERRGRK